MATNKIVYFPNPLLGKVLGAKLTSIGSSTLLTVAASNEYKYVRDFTVTMVGDSTSVGAIICNLKIGTGEFTFILNIGTAIESKIVSGKDIGFNGAWLQPTNTIIFSYVATVGGGTFSSVYTSVSVTVDDYYAV